MGNAKQKKVLAVLNLARLSVAQVLARCNAIVAALTGNKSFPAPAPTLAVLTAAIAALVDAETAAAQRTVGTVQTRNAKRDALEVLFKALLGYVQGVANADPEHAAALIESAGLTVRKSAARQPKQLLSARAGAVSGSVKLVAKAQRRASYEWQQSADGGKTWVSLAVTVQAHTTVAGLTPATTLLFRHRVVTKTGEGDWSNPVTFVVR